MMQIGLLMLFADCGVDGWIRNAPRFGAVSCLTLPPRSFRLFSPAPLYSSRLSPHRPSSHAIRKVSSAFPDRTMEAGNKSSKITTPFHKNGDTTFPIFIRGDFGDETATNIINNTDAALPEGAVLLWKRESCADNFDECLYWKNLRTTHFGRHLLWSPCLPSTQTFLNKNFHLLPLGTVCVADAQISGKGRSGNTWESPSGCLMFSFTLEMGSGRLLPFLQYVVSIALIDAIEHIFSGKGLPQVNIKIKWPNDIFANGIKIGGVLSTSTYRDKRFNVVVGVGLNIGNRQPTTCLDAIIQDMVPGTPCFQREEFLAVFFEEFEKLFNVFVKEGFAPMEDSYYKKWLHSGQVVTLEDNQDKTTSAISLVIQGLSPAGFLLAVSDQNEPYELHPDGNSLDFFKGLLRSKIQAKK